MLLRDIRLEKKLSLEEVSKSIGISLSLLSKIERGVSSCSKEVLGKLETFFNCKIGLPEIPYNKEKYLLLENNYNNLVKEYNNVAKQYNSLVELIVSTLSFFEKGADNCTSHFDLKE